MKAQNKTLVQSNAQQRSSRHQQRGNGLLYAMLGSALLALGSYYAYGIYSDKSQAASVQADITNAQDLAIIAQTNYGRDSTAYTTLDTAKLQVALPARMRVASGVNAVTSFNKAITAAPGTPVGGALGDVLVVSWTTPKAACVEFAAAVARFSRQVQVGGVDVKPLDLPFSGGLAGTNCDLSANPIVAFSIGRFAGM